MWSLARGGVVVRQRQGYGGAEADRLGYWARSSQYLASTAAARSLRTAALGQDIKPDHSPTLETQVYPGIDPSCSCQTQLRVAAQAIFSL